MCEPTTIALAAMAVAGGISAKASYDQGVHAKKVDEYNARVDENSAKEVRNKARIAENEERQKAAELVSRQRAVFAARGVNVDTGTALKVQEDTDLIGKVNAMRVRQNAEQQAQALETQAYLTKKEGKNAKRQGTMKAISTLIGTAGSVAGGMSATGTTGGPPKLWDSSTLGTGGQGAVASKWYTDVNKFNLGNQNLIRSLGRQ